MKILVTTKQKKLGVTAIITMLALAIIAIQLMLTLNYAWHIASWRPDDVSYLSNFYFKIREEGRWLYYILFPVLHRLNPKAVWYVNYAGFLFFFYRVSRLYTTNILTAILLAVICMQYPGYNSIALWPGTVLVCTVLLVAATYMVRVLSIWWFFIIFGILFFASYPPFYFFLPLLFLGHKYNSTQRPYSFSATIIGAWGVGFLSGHFFIINQYQ